MIVIMDSSGLVDVHVRLPREVAERARSCGLLEPDALSRAIRAALDERTDDEFFALRDAGGFGEHMTDDDVMAEVRAVRRERRQRAVAPS